MAPKFFMLLAMSLTLAAGQRPGFAGSRPIGFPMVDKLTTTSAGLGDRFGEDDVTTQRLPIEANGDRDLVDRLSKLPVDQQPFWFINWQALEANRKNPQTYPQKPSDFVDPIPNSGPTNSIRLPNLNTPNSNSKTSGATPSNIQPNQAAIETNSTSEIKNRFSDTDTSSIRPTTESNKNVRLTEMEYIATHSGSRSSPTALLTPSTISAQMPVHLSPPYQKTRFICKNPIID